MITAKNFDETFTKEYERVRKLSDGVVETLARAYPPEEYTGAPTPKEAQPVVDVWRSASKLLHKAFMSSLDSDSKLNRDEAMALVKKAEAAAVKAGEMATALADARVAEKQVGGP